MTEADWIRWVGVIAGVCGAIVVWPSGAKLMLLDIWAAIRRAWNRFIRRKKEPAPATHALGGLAAGQSTAGGRLTVRNYGAPPEAQIRRLWDEVDRLDGRIDQTEAENRAQLNALKERIEQESADRHAVQEAQRRRDERQDAQIDARGLPLIGLGIIMTGFPDGLARWAWVGLLFIALAALLVIEFALRPFSRWVASRLSRCRA